MLLPDFQASTVDSLHQLNGFEFIKTSTEVTCGCWIRNPLGSQRIEISLIGSAMLDVIQAGATSEQVHGDVQHMIRVVVGQVQLEHGGGFVDVLS